jgi:hypothetical protein
VCSSRIRRRPRYAAAARRDERLSLRRRIVASATTRWIAGGARPVSAVAFVAATTTALASAAAAAAALTAAILAHSVPFVWVGEASMSLVGHLARGLVTRTTERRTQLDVIVHPERLDPCRTSATAAVSRVASRPVWATDGPQRRRSQRAWACQASAYSRRTAARGRPLGELPAAAFSSPSPRRRERPARLLAAGGMAVDRGRPVRAREPTPLAAYGPCDSLARGRTSVRPDRVTAGVHPTSDRSARAGATSTFGPTTRRSSTRARAPPTEVARHVRQHRANIALEVSSDATGA